MRILLIEDDCALGALLQRRLGAESIVVDWVRHLEDARAACKDFAYDVVILDRRPPAGARLALMRALSASPLQTRTRAAEATGAMATRVSGLKAGARDTRGKRLARADTL